jgi:hypothetical protein
MSIQTRQASSLRAFSKHPQYQFGGWPTSRRPFLHQDEGAPGLDFETWEGSRASAKTYYSRKVGISEVSRCENLSADSVGVKTPTYRDREFSKRRRANAGPSTPHSLRSGSLRMTALVFRLTLEEVDGFCEVGDADVAGQGGVLAFQGFVHLPGYAAVAEVAGGGAAEFTDVLGFGEIHFEERTNSCG